MTLTDVLHVASAGMGAQRVRLQAVSGNVANANSTQGPDGGPYKRRVPVFESQALDPFGDALSREMSQVTVSSIEVVEGYREVYAPEHPDADENGNVRMPDIDVMDEMVDMMTAQRSYEANANIVDTTRELAMRALNLGR